MTLAPALFRGQKDGATPAKVTEKERSLSRRENRKKRMANPRTVVNSLALNFLWILGCQLMFSFVTLINVHKFVLEYVYINYEISLEMSWVLSYFCI